ncbi:smad nuclear-interacting protein 1 isoform X2 [Scleropages formosus]|uniref:Smad nuclear interacting protein 1 n=1 Tax=Scleropages formosus TaxID=113540 RepID=A0A8C9SEG6_SCLFO|nr:smad nuclear-interacting protein 1 isoform X2 [Scleropages formosus]
MEKESRQKGMDSPREKKIKLKQEKRSPGDRPQRPRRSSSASSRSSSSPVPHRRRASRFKRREHSSGRRDSRSPRRRRSRSPLRNTDVKIKREQEDYRGNEERRHRNRWETGDEHRGGQEAERSRHRERGGGGERGEERKDSDARAFQQQQAEREQYDERRRENRHNTEARGQGTEASTFGVPLGEDQTTKSAAPQKEQPNFELSGALVEDTNTFRGVVIKYNEPPEARIPKRRWRLYPFKNDEALPVMYIHRQSAYLLGRQRKIADIPIDHPSCSKQHAVFQYRLVEFTRSDGTTGRKVKPYIIDLGSGNGTYLNNQRIEPQRYYELKEKDVLKFGFSSREYVLLHEFSDTTEVDAKQQEEDDEGLDE